MMIGRSNAKYQPCFLQSSSIALDKLEAPLLVASSSSCFLFFAFFSFLCFLLQKDHTILKHRPIDEPEGDPSLSVSEPYSRPSDEPGYRLLHR